MEDPIVRSARREAIVVLVIWLAALGYTVGYCCTFGYGVSARELKFVRITGWIAFPDWIFWGIVVPWAVCFVISWWFSYCFVSDADLGEELEESDDVLGGGGNA